jgi:predicted DNA-binding transcriptional regulator YafY
MRSDRAVVIDYTNWKGERRKREVIPSALYYGFTEFHQEWQWILRAFDVEKNTSRDFAMKDVHGWEPTGG